MRVVFISHSDSEAAEHLEQSIRDAFPGAVSVFNTSRVASGLAAGESIDSGVLERLKAADLVVWLASPESVRRSFWMAWELGAATAFGSIVLGARCFGLPTTDLPLLQGGRFAPDLGQRNGMQALLVTIRDSLGLTQDRIAEVLTQYDGDDPSPLWGQQAKSLSMMLLGDRLLVENQSETRIEFIRFVLSGVSGTGGPRLTAFDDLASLGPRARSIITLNKEARGELPGQAVRVEWIDENGARHYSTVRILGDGK